MPNAFQILKPIQKSLKRIWVFRNTGANAVAKNQTRLAYEDKRDLYCIEQYSVSDINLDIIVCNCFCLVLIVFKPYCDNMLYKSLNVCVQLILKEYNFRYKCNVCLWPR